MKKLIISALLGMFVLVSCRTAVESLPLGEFPLEKSVIESNLETLGLPWTLGEEINQQNDDGDASNGVILNDENGKVIAVISSSEVEGIRFLSVSFMGKYYKKNVTTEITTFLPNELREETIQLATILYGGFSSEDAILKVFTKEYKDETKTIVKKDVDNKMNSKFTSWGKVIDGQSCFITVEEKVAGESEDYLSSIMIYSEIPENPQLDYLRELIELNS